MIILVAVGAGAVLAYLVERTHTWRPARPRAVPPPWAVLHLAAVVILWLLSPRTGGVPVALASYAVVTAACGIRRTRAQDRD